MLNHHAYAHSNPCPIVHSIRVLFSMTRQSLLLDTLHDHLSVLDAASYSSNLAGRQDGLSDRIFALTHPL